MKRYIILWFKNLDADSREAIESAPIMLLIGGCVVLAMIKALGA